MRTLLFFIALLGTLQLSAQDNKLAQQYYNDGEYEKSADLFLKLAKEKPGNSYYFDRYVVSLIKLERYAEAESALKKQLRKQPQEVALYVKYGQLLEQQFDEDGAKKQYVKAIDNLPADQYRITQLGNAFISETKYDYAILAYEKGARLLKQGQRIQQQPR